MEKRANGTLVWYWAICKRQVWLMSRQITPSREDENLLMGRALSETSYERDRKEVHVGNVKLDLLRARDGDVVVGEVKKSSRFEVSARLQLLYYLYRLSEWGVEARGQLLFPLEKRKVDVVLDEPARRKIEAIEKEIVAIMERDDPLPAVEVKWCKSCAYREYCWA